MSLTTIENFDITQTLPVISFDYESLRQWALSITDKYKNLVITEYDVKPIKKEMAELNKAKDKLNRARIDTVKAISAPIREFEEQIKDICGLFNDTYEGLARQVKDFENREREDKRKSVETLIYDAIEKAIADNPDLKDKIAISVKERWLNKTVTFNAIQEEINATIADQIRAEQERQRIERAQAERRILIENAVKAANEKYGISLSISAYMRDPYISLDFDAKSIMENIETEAELEAAKRDSKITPRKIEIEDVNQEQLAKEKPVSEVEDIPANNLIMFRLTALFTPEQEDNVREILNQNHFMKIVRQLQGIGVDVKFEKVNANEPK